MKWETAFHDGGKFFSDLDNQIEEFSNETSKRHITQR